MNYCLVRAITDNLQTLEWFFINHLTDQCARVQVFQGSQSEFIDAVKKCSYVLGLTSFHQVLFQKLQLPKVVKSKLTRVIPYALEEFLAEDIDNIHFVLLPLDKKQLNNNKRTVAYIKKEQISNWHELFMQMESTAYLISPFHVLPWNNKEWILGVGEKEFWLRNSIDSGICLERHHLARVLSECLSSQEQDQLIKLIPVGIDNVTEVSALLKKNRCRFNIQSTVKHISEIFDLKIVDLQAINLLQGDFSLQSEKKKTKKIWVYTVSTACIAVLSVLCLKLFLFHGLQQKQAYIQGQTLNAYKKIMPAATSLLSSRHEIIKKLEKNRPEDPEHFLVLLGVLNEVFNQFPKLKINSVLYKPGEFKVDASIATLLNYVQLQQALKKKGITIKRVSAKTENEQAHVVFLMNSEV